MATTRLVTPALFCTLEPGRVDGILLDAPVVELESGVELAQADLAGVCLIVVDEGVVIVRAEHLGSARGIVTCHAGPGRLVLPPGDGEAVRTLTPTRAMLLTTGIRDRLFAVPEAAVLLFDALAATLRQKHETIATLASIHHVDRVRDKLIQLAREHGRVRRDGVLLDFPLTHELLGEMVGSARETVTRALDELEEEGFVTRRGRSYRLNVAPEVLGTQSPAL
jgi:CRP-like cAMP-binding protein